MGTPASATSFTKFGFRIRTRSGMTVDNLVIHGRDIEDAQRKLRQMYVHCEVLECTTHRSTLSANASNFEDVIGLLTK